MSWLDADTTEESVSNFNLDDFKSIGGDEYKPDCGCSGGCCGGNEYRPNGDCGCSGGCEGCHEQTYTGGVHPAVIGPLVGLGLIIIGVLIVAYFYYSDEADPAGWIPDMSQETKYWGARAGAITAMVGVATAAAVPMVYAVRATKLWGLAFALIVIGIIVLVVSFGYDSFMSDFTVKVFGPIDENAAFWAKITGGALVGIGLLPIVGRAIFMGGKSAAKWKGRMDSYRSTMQSDDIEEYDHPFKDDDDGPDIYPGPESNSQNKPQIKQLFSQGMSNFKKKLS